VGYFEEVASTDTNCRVDSDGHSLKEFEDDDEMMKMTGEELSGDAGLVRSVNSKFNVRGLGVFQSNCQAFRNFPESNIALYSRIIIVMSTPMEVDQPAATTSTTSKDKPRFEVKKVS
jgi:hypothetical protein